MTSNSQTLSCNVQYRYRLSILYSNAFSFTESMWWMQHWELRSFSCLICVSVTWKFIYAIEVKTARLCLTATKRIAFFCFLFLLVRVKWAKHWHVFLSVETQTIVYHSLFAKFAIIVYFFFSSERSVWLWRMHLCGRDRNNTANFIFII